MNYYGPLEKMDENGKGSGLFHYVCSNDRDKGFAYPVGNCAQSEQCPDCLGSSNPLHGEFMWMPPGVERKRECSTCNNRGTVKKTNPCPGHATEDEAIEHQRQYELDHAKFTEVPIDKLQRQECEVCGEITNSYATIGPGMPHHKSLCPAHLNKESLATVFKLGLVWSS